MSKNWEENPLSELTVLIKKEFISENKHLKMGEKYIAYEKEDSYVVKVHTEDLQVSKEEFDTYFQIIKTKIYDVCC